MGKYFTRVIKYFIFISVLVTVVVLLLAWAGFADMSDIHTLFKNGYNAIWEMALIFFAVSLVYPKIAFGNRDFTLRAHDWNEAQTNMMIAMGDRGYKLERQEGKVYKFRKKWFLNRLAKFTEDRITITVRDDGSAPDDQTATDGSLRADTAAGSGDIEATPVAEPAAGSGDIEATQMVETEGELKKYVVNVEGLTKDVLRIVTALHTVQGRNIDG